jgi:hypothetical protein
MRETTEDLPRFALIRVEPIEGFVVIHSSCRFEGLDRVVRKQQVMTLQVQAGFHAGPHHRRIAKLDRRYTALPRARRASDPWIELLCLSPLLSRSLFVCILGIATFRSVLIDLAQLRPLRSRLPLIAFT